MRKINFWSFITSIICIVLFLPTTFSSAINYSIFGIDLIYLILYITLINFVLAVVGLGGIQDWKGLVRSVSTIILTVGLTAFLFFIIFIGNLFS
ncbi:hypothetical protein FS935_01445 [Metabacillus litoralis]|uniref:Uncharacterized protein n=1 Tax=Metabacillus litoralis TaxID=152268 RepID=A0A5C6W7H2_9BACI|nr:hypothetical protein [Metabacillus litoralis]TXC92885.1 hypothetical protein FS935_01445 [Metabacillus litoralis]